MFSSFKSRFIWAIITTFLSGIVTGGFIIMIDLEDNLKNILIMGLFSILSTLGVYLNWKNIFHQLDFQDKINSIYTDID